MRGVDKNCFILGDCVVVAAVAPQSHAATHERLPMEPLG